jgi:hypothetical protein
MRKLPAKKTVHDISLRLCFVESPPSVFRSKSGAAGVTGLPLDKNKLAVTAALVGATGPQMRSLDYEGGRTSNLRA